MNCTCGHAEEDHIDGGVCTGRGPGDEFEGTECPCVMYEEDEEDDL